MTIRELLIKLNYLKQLSSPQDLLRVLANYNQLKATLNQPWLQAYHFTHILDIGANTGQFAKWAHTAFPVAAIHSFEALPTCIQILQKQKAALNTNWTIHPFALGNANKTVEIHTNSFSPSSSLLRLHTNHKKLFPHAQESISLKIPMRTLDSLSDLYPKTAVILAKLDVQGFESQVIDGGLETFRRCQFIICEVSYVTLFQGQTQAGDIIKKILSLGFDFSGIIEQTTNPQSFQPIFADLAFTKKL